MCVGASEWVPWLINAARALQAGLAAIQNQATRLLWGAMLALPLNAALAGELMELYEQYTDLVRICMHAYLWKGHPVVLSVLTVNERPWAASYRLP